MTTNRVDVLYTLVAIHTILHKEVTPLEERTAEITKAYVPGWRLRQRSQGVGIDAEAIGVTLQAHDVLQPYNVYGYDVEGCPGLADVLKGEILVP